MSYAAPFHRLVMIGELYSDVFNVTLTIMPTGGGVIPAVTQSLADSARATIATWWPKLRSTSAGAGIEMSPDCKLTSIKLNRIGTDGKYMDATAIESVLTTPVAGGGTGRQAAQLTVAATLRGTNPRGRAGRGRMYFPPGGWYQGVLAADGRLPATEATNYARGVVTLIQNINDVYVAAGVAAVAGIASKAGAGAFQPVDSITVGRVIDTMRSRRNKLPEDFVEVSI